MNERTTVKSQNSPKISCIVPVYNVENYLRRCLDSILAQTFTDFECICVDDGSPDGSGKILDEYAEKDSRFVVIHKENGGVSSARNAGLDAARGEYVCFVDSDDWVETDYMKKMYESATEIGADLVVCGIKQQNDEINFNKTKNNIVCKNQDDFRKVFFRMRKGLETGESLHSPVNKLYKYNLLNRIRFDEDFIMGEDYVFNLEYYAKTESALFIPQNLYFYFLNPNSATHSISKKMIENKIALCDATFNFCKAQKIDMQCAKKFQSDILYECVSLLICSCTNGFSDISFGILKKRVSLQVCFLQRNILHFFIMLFYKIGFKNLLLTIYKAKDVYKWGARQRYWHL